MSIPSDAPWSAHTVVLVHGFAAAPIWMRRLQDHFQRLGADTLNWGYPSLFRSIDDHAEALADRVRELARDNSTKKINFITHSMGCIVTRAALLKYQPSRCGRWVMLAPPNRGSYIATVLSLGLGRWFPPLRELTTRTSSYVNGLPEPSNIEVAVIRARLDYIVAPGLTSLSYETERCTVPGLHSAMLLRHDVATHCEHFLEHGTIRGNERSTPGSRQAGTNAGQSR